MWRVIRFFSMRKCKLMNKTSEAVIFSACIPFAPFNTGTYASRGIAKITVKIYHKAIYDRFLQ